MSTCLLAFRANTRLFQTTIPKTTECQLVQGLATITNKNEDATNQPRTVAYKKVGQNGHTKKNYSMFSEYQQASQATSRDNSNDQVK